jgi:uncharacterized protein YbjT (DUF2867 family)
VYVILGGTGHVGSELATRLIERGEPITIVSRNREKEQEWRSRGAEIAVADVNDVAQLRAVLALGTRLFLLNPPAAPDSDTDAVERRSVASILQALDGLRPERVVAQSTYGAQPGNEMGDMNVLFELEQGLKDTTYPVHIIRAAYYFSNWDMALEEARETGTVTSFYPEDFALPMVAPADLGAAAATFLATDECAPGIHYVEGPQRYSPRDVADALGRILNKPIDVSVIPEEDWERIYQQVGFSRAGAHSYAQMTAVTRHERYELPIHPRRGAIGLDEYFAALPQVER